MTSRELELEKAVADLKRRLEIVERALAKVENALRQPQRRGLTAADKPREPRYKPLARTFALLRKQVAESGPWNSSLMGMTEPRFNHMVLESYNLQAFLRAVLEALLGVDRMASVNLGRSSERGEAMDFETRDRLYRLVAKYVNTKPQNPPVNFTTLNNDVAHILSNNKRSRIDDSDASSDDDGAERRKDAGNTPKRGKSNEEHAEDAGEGPSGVRGGNIIQSSSEDDEVAPLYRSEYVTPNERTGRDKQAYDSEGSDDE